MTILFFHIPSFGMYNQIEPVLVELTARGHRVVHYNADEFRAYSRNAAIEFRGYEHYDGYRPALFSREMSVYELGLLLLRTAEQMLPLVAAACLREGADVVLHSKFVAAAKVAAHKLGLPAASLTTGYVFQPRFVAREPGRSRPNLATIASAIQFRRGAKQFYEQHGVEVAVEDMFMNEETLNVVLGLEEFQPDPGSLRARFTFVGPTVNVNGRPKRYDVNYASLGSVFSGNRAFFEQVLHALGQLRSRAIVSLGDRLSPDDFTNVPQNVRLLRFVPQVAILDDAALFITHGGAGSIYEGLASATPMLVVPQIPEQAFFGRQVARLGIGRCLEMADVTSAALVDAASEMLRHDAYRQKIRSIRDKWSFGSAAADACDQIEGLVRRRVLGNF
jgi:MGT family glycosyltransferase